MPRRIVLVTGGTGALGRELVQRLASDRTVDRVIVLSRAPGAPCSLQSAGVWGRTAMVPVDIVRGDIGHGPTLELCPAELMMLHADVTEIVHCAALTTFTAPLETARAVNVAGTAHLLAFAARCPALEKVAAFSTVYVAGRRTGLFTEDDRGDAESGFVNSYERSKAEMEEIVRGAMPSLPVALYRLSTMIGDSATGTVHTYNSVHHALRLLYQGLAPMIPGAGDATVDLIPVDYAASAAHHLIQHAFEPGLAYHVCAGERAPSLDGLLDATIDAFHRYRPAWRKRSIARPALVDLDTYALFVRSVEEADNAVLLEATRSVQAFAYQLAYPKRFDRRRTLAALGGTQIDVPDVLDFYPRIVRHCVETGWGAAA